MPTLTRSRLVDDLRGRVPGLSRSEAADLVETLFDVVTETLEIGGSVRLSGFGGFVVRDKQAHPGRNPQTGELITIAPRRVVVFKASEALRGSVNREPRGRGSHHHASAP